MHTLKRFAVTGTPAGVPRFAFWHVVVAELVALAAAPLVAIVASFRAIDSDVWHHLTTYLLPTQLLETAQLLLVVLLLAFGLGVGLAWLTTAYRFPGVALFRWALLLPLAMPAYVLGFVYLAWFDVTGSVTLLLRRWDIPLPQVRTLWGAAWVLALALYPYVYLAARVAFVTTSARALEVGQALGLTRRQAFWRVAVPLARPAIVAGCALVAFEVLADFGVVALFGVETLSVGIYKAWYALFSLPTAMQIAALLAFLAILALLFEQWARKRARFTTTGRSQPLAPTRLASLPAWSATLVCTVVLAVALLLPVAQLGVWAGTLGRDALTSRYWHFFANSLLLGGSGAFVTVMLALLLAYAQRLDARPLMHTAVRIATVGYALPGAVLAVGVVAVTSAVDHAWVALGRGFGAQWAPLLGGTVVAMLIAYAIRFLVVAFGPVQSALGRVTTRMDEAAHSLGETQYGVLRRIHLPLLRPALFAAAALVFIDILKELPITLMTRPFGWETLATRIFELTNDGRWEEAALPALAVTLAGTVPAWFLAKEVTHPTSAHTRETPC
ncbi:binding-protein-dependent transport system inner membrane protein [Hydrogenophilus thermoluteolus]|nr:binding-protein-dependent transport system inner membrane protein [Hydrogenophilus thermoluteolus]